MKVVSKLCSTFLLFLFLSSGFAFSQIPSTLTPGLTVMVTPVLTADSNSTSIVSQPQPSVTLSRTTTSQTQQMNGNNDNFYKTDHSDPNYLPQPPKPEFDFEKNFFDRNHFQIETGVGADFLSQNFNTVNGFGGFGAEFGVGYLLDKHWSFWISQYLYSFDDFQFFDAYSWETVISTHYNFWGPFIRPYFVLGGGLLGINNSNAFTRCEVFIVNYKDDFEFARHDDSPIFKLL